ncbi:hypothetical protein EASAB2608_00164 [Streptomyces sp. EAS-AB2608]|nr:hypothetical protein EASAB2608_00164 [Streptomyces sp. EAS-AB2608]
MVLRDAPGADRPHPPGRQVLDGARVGDPGGAGGLPRGEGVLAADRVREVVDAAGDPRFPIGAPWQFGWSGVAPAPKKEKRTPAFPWGCGWIPE